MENPQTTETTLENEAVPDSVVLGLAFAYIAGGLEKTLAGALKRATPEIATLRSGKLDEVRVTTRSEETPGQYARFVTVHEDTAILRSSKGAHFEIEVVRETGQRLR